MRPQHETELIRRVWPDVFVDAGQTFVLGLSDSRVLAVLCRDRHISEAINRDSARLVADINDRAGRPGLVSGIVGHEASAADRVLATVLSEALDRIERLTDEIARLRDYAETLEQRIGRSRDLD